jgi:hypothetical protein
MIVAKYQTKWGKLDPRNSRMLCMSKLSLSACLSLPAQAVPDLAGLEMIEGRYLSDALHYQPKLSPRSFLSTPGAGKISFPFSKAWKPWK